MPGTDQDRAQPDPASGQDEVGADVSAALTRFPGDLDFLVPVDGPRGPDPSAPEEGASAGTGSQAAGTESPAAGTESQAQPAVLIPGGARVLPPDWRERLHALQSAAQALAAARRVFSEAARDYRTSVHEPLDRAADAEYEAEEAERAAQDQARREVEQAAAQEAERAKDAEFGPAVYWINLKRLAPSSRGSQRVLHYEGCRHAVTWHGQPVRAAQALERLLADPGIRMCGTCRVQAHLRAATDGAEEILDAVAEARRHRDQPLQPRKMAGLLEGVSPRFDVDARSGLGQEGWSMSARDSYVHLTWRVPGQGAIGFPDREVQDIAMALLEGGYRVEFTGRDPAGTPRRSVRTIMVTRMSAVQAETARALGTRALWLALSAEVPVAEALDLAAQGKFDLNVAEGLAALHGRS